MHRTESVSVMDHKQTMEVSSRVLDQHLWPYLVVLEHATARSPKQLNRGENDWLIQTPVSTIQPGMLVQPGRDTLCIQFSAEWPANVVDLERQW